MKRKLGNSIENEIATKLKQQGWSILARSQRIAGVECDLIARDPNKQIWIIEVKYRRHASSWGLDLLKTRQYRRQMRALRALSKQFPNDEVRWALIWRKKSGGVEFVANPCYF